jgi:hypothetical protein
MAVSISLRFFARATVVVAVALAAGCFEDPLVVESGSTSTSDDSNTTGADTTTLGMETSGTTADADSDSDSGSTAPIDPGSSSDDGTSSSGADESSSTGEPCNTDLPSIHWASDATLTAPMMLTTALFLPGQPQMAYSSAAESGTVTFAFELACAGTISVQGLVWDYHASNANPDSFYASIDGEPFPELEWPYGCATTGLGNESWSWQPLASGSRDGCTLEEPHAVELQAGPHELTLRNREAGDGFDIAAITAVVISEDPELDATKLYDPNP